MITLTREEAQQVLDALEKSDFYLVQLILQKRLAQPEPEREKGDMPCIEDDGCPTEKAVLQRFWRKHRQPEQEPVAWVDKRSLENIENFDATIYYKSGFDFAIPLYTAPPQREWQGLTDEEKREIFNSCEREDRGYVAAMVEAKLKEKNA